MFTSAAVILSLLLPLSQALPSPATGPTLALGRSDGHAAPHSFAAAAGHKPRLVRRKKAKRACVPKSLGPVVLHPSGSSVANVTSTTSTAMAPTTSAVESATSSTASASSTIPAQEGAAKPVSSHVTSSTAVASSTMASSAVASSSSAAASPAPTSPAPLMGNLFPARGTNWWSTSTEASPSMSFTSALKPLTAGKLPSSSTAPDGSDALVANFPAGTVKFSSSTGAGFSFYTEGNHNGVDVTGAKEVIFSYSVYFESGFDFVKGGKMPGLYGGTSLSAAKSCSGGRQDNRDECFSTRLMWRTNGMGEIYNYLPTSVTQGGGYCETAPKSICDTVYGDSIGRGSYTWATGAWTTVAQRIKLNDVGVANGEQQLWVNGESIMHLTGLQLIVKDAKIYGIMAQTFFGGSDQSWASPKDQSAWFKDWSLSVIS